jgi:hypothetical protein
MTKLKFEIDKIKYYPNITGILYLDISVGEENIMIIHEIEIRRRHDGYLEIKFPYKESLMNFRETPLLTFKSYEEEKIYDK